MMLIARTIRIGHEIGKKNPSSATKPTWAVSVLWLREPKRHAAVVFSWMRQPRALRVSCTCEAVSLCSVYAKAQTPQAEEGKVDGFLIKEKKKTNNVDFGGILGLQACVEDLLGIFEEKIIKKSHSPLETACTEAALQLDEHCGSISTS